MEYTEDYFDLSILYTQDAIQWCEYLFDIFKDFNVQQNSEDVLDIINNLIGLENIKNSMMNVVIISPLFLQKCNPKIEEHLHHVVGLLCGVEDSDMDELFEMIPSAKNWTQVDATAGGNEITHVVLKVLSDAGKEKMTGDTEDTYLPMIGQVNLEAQDDYMDMRVKSHEPPENTYFERGPAPEEEYESMKPLAPPGGHVFEPVKGYVNMKEVKNMSQCSPGMTIQPEEAASGEGGVLFVIFQDDLISMSKQDQYVVSFNGKLRISEVPAIQKNPYTLEIQLPKDHPAEIVDGQVLSPCKALMGTFKFLFKSVMDDLALALLNITDPMKFMCQALGISSADSNELDNILFEHIQHDFRNAYSSTFCCHAWTEKHVFHVDHLSRALQAMKMKNRHGLTPDGLAAKNGHSDLSSLLENFVDSAEDEGIQTEGSAPTSSYLFMKPGFATYYKNEDFLQQLRKKTQNYDLPFKVPIPAMGIAEDETIKELMQGKREDIEDFYDSLTLDFGSFERDPDPEEDYEEILDETGNIRRSTKKTISRRPPIKHPSEEKAESPGATTPVEPKAPTKIDANVQESSPTKKDKSVFNLPGVGVEQQALIDLQNSVKSNDITLDEAVLLFRNYNLIQQQQSKSMALTTHSAKTPRKDTKSGGLRNFLTKKQTKKGIMTKQTRKNRAYSEPIRGSHVPMPLASPKVQEKSISELTTRTNRPISTTSSASSGSRGSVLSISDRDSSYSSTVEEVEQERNQPVLRRHEKIIEKSSSQQERMKRLSAIPDFSQDYIQKPVPAIPGRSPKQIPQSLQDLPKPVPPVPSPDYSQFRVPPSSDQQPEYLEFDGPPDEKAPEDLPALPPPPVPSPEVSQRPERTSDPVNPMSPRYAFDVSEIKAGKNKLKPDVPSVTPKKPVQKPVPRPRAAPRN